MVCLLCSKHPAVTASRGINGNIYTSEPARPPRPYRLDNYLSQGFPTFFTARTPLSGQSILSTPQKILRYILLYKRYISCSVTQGSSYPLMFNLVPLGYEYPRLGTSDLSSDKLHKANSLEKKNSTHFTISCYSSGLHFR